MVMPAIIKFADVSKSYGDLPVLRHVNFEAQAGEKVAIIGPSGSGKSTLLRLLMTLEKPSQGQIWIDGKPIWQKLVADRSAPADAAHLREIRSKVSMVFQHFNLFPHMNVLRNITEAPMCVLGLSREEAAQRALQLLDMVGLATKKDAFPVQLSGGQKQRVAIARALAMKPKILLFDEITSALDPELVGEVLNVLRDLAKTRDYTMLIVTHQMKFAQEIAERIVFFDQGQIVESGPPQSIFSQPKEERTKTFLKAVLEI